MCVPEARDASLSIQAQMTRGSWSTCSDLGSLSAMISRILPVVVNPAVSFMEPDKMRNITEPLENYQKQYLMELSTEAFFKMEIVRLIQRKETSLSARIFSKETATEERSANFVIWISLKLKTGTKDKKGMKNLKVQKLKGDTSWRKMTSFPALMSV